MCAFATPKLFFKLITHIHARNYPGDGEHQKKTKNNFVYEKFHKFLLFLQTFSFFFLFFIES